MVEGDEELVLVVGVLVLTTSIFWWWRGGCRCDSGCVGDDEMLVAMGLSSGDGSGVMM